MSASTPAAQAAARMAEATHEFLERLDHSQRGLAHWDFPSDEERRLWFYTPTDHGGLPPGDMSPSLQRLALKLVASGLSRPDFVTVSTALVVAT